MIIMVGGLLKITNSNPTLKTLFKKCNCPVNIAVMHILKVVSEKIIGDIPKIAAGNGFGYLSTLHNENGVRAYPFIATEGTYNPDSGNVDWKYSNEPSLNITVKPQKDLSVKLDGGESISLTHQSTYVFDGKTTKETRKVNTDDYK